MLLRGLAHKVGKWIDFVPCCSIVVVVVVGHVDIVESGGRVLCENYTFTGRKGTDTDDNILGLGDEDGDNGFWRRHQTEDALQDETTTTVIRQTEQRKCMGNKQIN